MINLKYFMIVNSIFHISVDHSKKLNAILNFIGIKSVHIDGKTGNRSYILEEFRDGKIQVICNKDLLAVGFDSPKIDVVMICRPVGSMGLKLQMIGRGLRGRFDHSHVKTFCCRPGKY